MNIENFKGYVTKQYKIELIVINSDLSEYEQEFTIQQISNMTGVNKIYLGMYFNL